MTKIIKAKIRFIIVEGHPSFEYVENKHKVFEFEDTYTIETDFFDSNKQIIDYIENDLKLVSGGGYSTKYIENVMFTFK